MHYPFGGKSPLSPNFLTHRVQNRLLNLIIFCSRFRRNLLGKSTYRWKIPLVFICYKTIFKKITHYSVLIYEYNAGKINTTFSVILKAQNLSQSGLKLSWSLTRSNDYWKFPLSGDDLMGTTSIFFFLLENIHVAQSLPALSNVLKFLFADIL